MKVTTFLFCISSYFLMDVNGFLDIGIIKSYFKKKSTNRAVIVGCFRNKEKAQIMKALLFDKQTITVGNVNDIDIFKILFTRYYHMGVILNGDCYNVSLFLEQCSKKKYFGVKYHWLIMTEMKNFFKVFENSDLYINADINIIFPEINGTQRKYIIEDIYNPAYERGGELKRKIVGYYTIKNGYNILEITPKFMDRKNMTGVTLRSEIVLPVPFDEPLMEYLQSKKNPEINTFNRCHFSIMQSCIDFYNFTLNVTTTNSWGYQTANGLFDGIVGSLYNGSIDYGSSPLFVRTDRAHFMEYGRRTWTLRAAFVFRDPKTVSSVDIFLKPLSLSIWLLTFFSATLGVVLLRISGYCEKYKGQEISWSFFMVCTIAALCQQGASSTPYLFSGRIIFLFLLVLSTMIYQFYSASLVSSLLMTPPTKIKTIEDIVKSDMTAGCEDVLYNRDYLKYTTDGPSKELYQKKILGKRNNSNFLEPDEGLALVEKGGYAFHVELATAYPIIRSTFSEEKICELHEIQMYRTQPMHSNVQIDSPYRDMIDTCLQRLAEYGIMEREITFWHPKKPACLRSSQNSQITIGLNYFYPALLVLVLGMIMGVVLLILEIYWSRKESTKPQKKLKKKPIVVYVYVN